MPSPVADCPEHGPCEGTDCPVCGRSLEPVLSGSRRRQLSKFVSGALRHFPEDAGLELDNQGWTEFESLVGAVERKYDWADEQALRGVVMTDPKGRFELSAVSSDAKNRDSEREAGRPVSSDDHVRAAYGHSVDVDLESSETPVPDTLYHGTAPRNLDSIFEEGLRPMNRQQVHLSGTVQTAREVGARHSDDPVILAIDAATMLEDGHDITKRGREVFTTEHVPPTYLSEHS
jgi:putative RNA 2'-phosphotransferase